MANNNSDARDNGDSGMSLMDEVKIRKLQIVSAMTTGYEDCVKRAGEYVAAGEPDDDDIIGIMNSADIGAELLMELQGRRELLELVITDQWMLVPAHMVMTVETMANPN